MIKKIINKILFLYFRRRYLKEVSRLLSKSWNDYKKEDVIDKKIKQSEGVWAHSDPQTDWNMPDGTMAEAGYSTKDGISPAGIVVKDGIIWYNQN